ncbi:hypothetical protein AV530_002543 [Patagioenas fasciata monilis]|uniref:Uncharacterized protein n=1 Tax=Patagioenas fasciata monilis TaxID=372326 RepID=A0A1V4K6U4_PATFA|nr:hypothetical protein AV530_002543 [Patagioenas fasciata monilis]
MPPFPRLWAVRVARPGPSPALPGSAQPTSRSAGSTCGRRFQLSSCSSATAGTAGPATLAPAGLRKG